MFSRTDYVPTNIICLRNYLSGTEVNQIIYSSEKLITTHSFTSNNDKVKCLKYLTVLIAIICHAGAMLLRLR